MCPKTPRLGRSPPSTLASATAGHITNPGTEQPQQKSPRDRPRPHRAGRSRTPRPHQPRRRARTPRRDLATPSRLTPTGARNIRPTTQATRTETRTGPRPLRASGPHRSPSHDRTARRLASPCQLGGERSPAGSEAVSTRDAHPPRSGPTPLRCLAGTSPAARANDARRPIHRFRRTRLPRPDQPSPRAPSQTCQRQRSPATARRIHPRVNLNAVMWNST